MVFYFFMSLPSHRCSRLFETERLTLAPHTLEDFDDSFGMWSDPAVTRYTTGRPPTEEEVWARLQRYAGSWALMGYGYWVVRERSTGAFVGEVGFGDFRRAIVPPFQGAPEIGWALVSHAWGRGLATEAVVAALSWADQALGVRTVCLISQGNVASRRVAEKCGYRAYAEATYKETPVLLFERAPTV